MSFSCSYFIHSVKFYKLMTCVLCPFVGCFIWFCICSNVCFTNNMSTVPFGAARVILSTSSVNDQNKNTAQAFSLQVRWGFLHIVLTLYLWLIEKFQANHYNCCVIRKTKKPLPAPVPQYGKVYDTSTFFCLTKINKINCIDFNKVGMYVPTWGK